MHFSFTAVSRNAKTGPIPVVTASKSTCPSDCPLIKNGCYAENAPLAWRWAELNEGGLSFEQLLRAIRRLPRGQLWRYGQAGDLPSKPEEVLELAKASRGRPAIVYTHKRDFVTYQEARQYGMHINLSASSLEEANTLAKEGLPVVTVLPSSFLKGKTETVSDYRRRLGGKLHLKTELGHIVAICPATYFDTDCSKCRACAKPRPGNVIIGFPAHGNRAKLVDGVVGSNPWITKSLMPLPTSPKT